MPDTEQIPIDPLTDRPYGDHGSAAHALQFALQIKDDLDAMDFLRSWNEGDVASCWGFYPWLKRQEA